MATPASRQHIDDIDRAWAAGLFEGEGCFAMHRPRRQNSIRLTAQLQMADEDAMRTFFAIVGVGNLRRRETRRGKRKPMWLWVCGGKDVEAVFDIIGPWLHKRRTDRYHELAAERRAYELTLPAMYSANGRANASGPRRQLDQSEGLF